MRARQKKDINMSKRKHTLGRDPFKDEWVTGQIVPESGTWKDQHCKTSIHVKGRKFPPIQGEHECAHRVFVPKNQNGDLIELFEFNPITTEVFKIAS